MLFSHVVIRRWLNNLVVESGATGNLLDLREQVLNLLETHVF